MDMYMMIDTKEFEKIYTFLFRIRIHIQIIDNFNPRHRRRHSKNIF